MSPKSYASSSEYPGSITLYEKGIRPGLMRLTCLAIFVAQLFEKVL